MLGIRLWAIGVGCEVRGLGYEVWGMGDGYDDRLWAMGNSYAKIY